jgi:hypothetical protein
MSESEHKKKLGKSDNGLTPEPPGILKKLLWLKLYGRKHWKLIFVAVLASSVIFICNQLHPFFRSIPKQTNPQTSSVSKNLPQTFNFVDFEDTKLRQAIEESTSLKFDMSNDVSYNIEFTHTGGLRPGFKEGYCLFDGGVAVIKINESECCEIPEIKLQAWSDNPGNPKNILESKIEEELKQKLRDHRELVGECLIRCLKNER